MLLYRFSSSLFDEDWQKAGNVVKKIRNRTQ
jgi:hypothetical protein